MFRQVRSLCLDLFVFKIGGWVFRSSTYDVSFCASVPYQSTWFSYPAQILDSSFLILQTPGGSSVEYLPSMWETYIAFPAPDFSLAQT